MSTPSVTVYESGPRSALRERHLAPVTTVMREATALIELDDAARSRIHAHAMSLAAEARRRAAREGFALSLIHRFGLDTPQGIALMQLAEALPRIAVAHSAHALIADKIGTL